MFLLYVWLNKQETSDLVTVAEEISNEKLHFLRSVFFKYGNVYFQQLNFVPEILTLK